MPAKVAARPGFDAIPAVRDGFLREIKSPLILQPGPAALTDGLDALERIVAEWVDETPAARRLMRIAAADGKDLRHNGTRTLDLEADPQSDRFGSICCWSCS